MTNDSGDDHPLANTLEEAADLLAHKIDLLASHQEMLATYCAIEGALSPEKAELVRMCIEELQRAEQILLLATTDKDVADYFASIERFGKLSARAGLAIDKNIGKPQ